MLSAHLDRETGDINPCSDLWRRGRLASAEEVDSPDGFSRSATSTIRQDH